MLQKQNRIYELFEKQQDQMDQKLLIRFLYIKLLLQKLFDNQLRADHIPVEKELAQKVSQLITQKDIW